MDYLNKDKGALIFKLLTPDKYAYANGVIFDIYSRLFADVPHPSKLIGMDIMDSQFSAEKHINCVFEKVDGSTFTGSTFFVCSEKRSFFFAAHHWLGDEKYAELVDYFENRFIRQLKIQELV